MSDEHAQPVRHAQVRQPARPRAARQPRRVLLQTRVLLCRARLAAVGERRRAFACRSAAASGICAKRLKRYAYGSSLLQMIRYSAAFMRHA